MRFPWSDPLSAIADAPRHMTIYSVPRQSGNAAVGKFFIAALFGDVISAAASILDIYQDAAAAHLDL
jgi:hypothetical protein